MPRRTKLLALTALVTLSGCRLHHLPKAPWPCRVSDRERREITARLDRVDAAIESEDRVTIARANVELAALLRLPAFATHDGSPAVQPPRGARSLVDWWRRGGETWMRMKMFGDPLLAYDIPPTPRTPAEFAPLPAEVLCERRGCDPKASAFVATEAAWGLRLEAYERGRYRHHWKARPHHLEQYEPAADGESWAQRQCETDSVEAWIECLAQRRSAEPMYPIGDYRFPTRGWLFIDEHELDTARAQRADDCPQYTAIELETGRVRAARACEVLERRASIDDVRELGLAVILATSAEEISPLHRFVANEAVPPLAPGPARCSIRASPPPMHPTDATPGRLAYWWYVHPAVVSHAVLAPESAAQPASGFARKRLRAVDSVWDDVAASVSLPPINLQDPSFMRVVDGLR